MKQKCTIRRHSIKYGKSPKKDPHSLVKSMMDWAILKWTKSDHFTLKKKKKTESIKPKEPICLPQKKTKKNKNEKGNSSAPKEKPHPQFAPSLSDQQKEHICLPQKKTKKNKKEKGNPSPPKRNPIHRAAIMYSRFGG